MGLVNKLRGSRIYIDTAPFIYLSETRPQSRTTELGTFGTNVPPLSHKHIKAEVIIEASLPDISDIIDEVVGYL